MTETDPARVEARHLESKGIGYNVGYTTLGIFYASTEAWNNRWIPLLDVRGHIFNNGQAAINSGIGLRYTGKRVWGLQGYYDYRNTSHGHYNQIAIGLESLGASWDFRLNGYHPIGNKVHKKEFALQAVNAEAGLHVRPLYFAAGPYYLTGEGRAAWGGQVRGSVQLFKYFQLDLITSYDHLYGWTAQGQFGIYYLFGGKKEGRPRPPQAFQRIERFEIMPIYRRL